MSSTHTRFTHAQCWSRTSEALSLCSGFIASSPLFNNNVVSDKALQLASDVIS